jgi:hypothetical protein
MRLYPPAWIMGRENMEEMTLGGYRVPVKSQLLCPTWVLHRDPRWFDRPLRFEPQRWLDGLAERGARAGDLCGLPGLNARAALITRGLAEMTRLGVALGARPETFMGLSGLGDLVLTATGSLSRNRRVGWLLAEGHSLEQALGALGHVAEGVHSARTVWARARALGVEMPITQAVVALLEGRLTPDEAVARLMAREARAESPWPADDQDPPA